MDTIMVQMTMQVPNELAERIEPVGAWLPTIIELSLIGFKTTAIATASEITAFLLQNPTPQEVFDYHVSEEAQARLRRLLALNEAGILSETERQELDELQQLEHVIIMLKARIAGNRS
jgi:hypothetical protein